MPGAPANDNVPGTLTPDDAPFFLALGLICAAIVALAIYAGTGGPDGAVAALRGSMDSPPAYADGVPGHDGGGVIHRSPPMARSFARPGSAGGGSGHRAVVSASEPSALAKPDRRSGR